MSLPPWQSLSLEQQIAQLLVIRTTGHLFDHQIAYPQWEATNAQLRHWLGDLGVGGVILLGGSAAELHDRTQQLHQWARLPLVIAADIEEGVGQRFAGATVFPPPMALGEIWSKDRERAQELAAEMGRATALEALALGINWILAPIADVNNNPANPVINIRAFGEDPEQVGDLVTAFIAGCGDFPVLTTAKHFPGHGDTDQDSHLTLPTIAHSADRLQRVELLPFQRAIAAGVDTVMTAHLQVPAWDGDNPATLSKAILEGQLRDRCGFAGPIVTDALVMAGVVDRAPPGALALQALAAGADILLMPPDPEAAIATIAQAIRRGDLPKTRLHQAINRLWHIKNKILPGLTPAQPWTEEIALPRSRQAAQAILTESRRGQGHLIPLLPGEVGHNLIIVDDLLKCDDLRPQSPALQLPQSKGYQPLPLDLRHLSLGAIPEGAILLQIFLRGNPFRGQSQVQPLLHRLCQELLTKGQLRGIALYGSPYLIENLSLDTSDRPWFHSPSFTPEAQTLAWQNLCPSSPFGDRPPDFI